MGEENSGILNKEKSQARSILLLVILVIMYIFENYSPKFMRTSYYFIYIYKPAMWIIIAAIAAVLSRGNKVKDVVSKASLMWWTVLLSSVYILINIFMGLLLGFGRSPYNHSLSGIVMNLIFVFSPLIGRELARNYFARKFADKNYKLVIVIISILFTFLNVRFSFNDFTYLGSSVLPEFCNNLLASYLVFIGGPILSIIYLGVIESFYYTFPILPDISWVISVVVGMLYPILSIMIIKRINSFQGKEDEVIYNEGNKRISWILIMIISVSLVWFSAGALPIRPMVIATGSMEPTICAGDIVLTKKVKVLDLKKGDIIQFKSGSIYIFHRIIDIVEEGGVKKYKTKGDNNPVPDTDLVNDKDIKGKVIYTLPKIGRPTLVLRQH